MSRFDDIFLLLGRILIAVLFLGGAAQKAVSPSDAMELLARLHMPTTLVWPALAFNLITGIALLAGWQTRLFALAAAAYCAFTSIFHFLPDDPWQMTIFVKNWSIAGGCLALAVAGAGRFAVRR